MYVWVLDCKHVSICNMGVGACMCVSVRLCICVWVDCMCEHV